MPNVTTVKSKIMRLFQKCKGDRCATANPFDSAEYREQYLKDNPEFAERYKSFKAIYQILSQDQELLNLL